MSPVMRLFGNARKDQERDRTWTALADEEAGAKRKGSKGNSSYQSMEAQAGQSSSKLQPKIDDANDLDTQPFVATIPEFSKGKLLLWRLSIILPFLVAGCLLYLLTCSASSWRANWGSIKIELPSTEFEDLYASGSTIIRHSSNSTSSRRDYANHVSAKPIHNKRVNDTDNASGGYLSLNMWGWCLKSIEQTTAIMCSSESMWFNMDDLVDSSSIHSRELIQDTFNPFLVHALIVHGFAMLSTMLALIPIALNTWRILRAQKPKINTSWFENITLLLASILCLVSWIVNRCLQASVSSKLLDYNVDAGLASIIMGVLSILLAATFLISAVPCLYLHMRRQNQLLKYWMNLEDYDEAVARQHSSEEAVKGNDKNYDMDNKGRATRRPRPRGLRDHRLTKMIFGGGYDDSKKRKDKSCRQEEQASQRHRGSRSRRRDRRKYGHRRRHSRR
ncbi:hypothetical protein AYX13_01900 [Cryptococcus neoformans]|nr:hypothetical protein AYX13_01900 [Cryptococcus neoformans var. grubii]